MDNLVYQRLQADATISGIVNGRVYPVWPEYDAQIPLIVYSRTITEDQYCMAGSSGIKKYEYQIDCWSVNADTARSLSDAVYNSLVSWRSPVQGAFLSNDMQEQTDIGYHIEQSYVIWM